MQKIFLTLVAALLLAPAATQAQRTTGYARIDTKTHFAGDRITGVAATAAFDVVLVKSDRTRAVVEVSDVIASEVRITRSGDGVVSVGLHEMSGRVQRAFNRLPDREKIMKLTLYLPTLNTIRLTGATDLYTSDDFPGEDVDIHLSGASEIDEELVLSSRRVKIQCSGASEASFVLNSTDDLVVLASGASDIDIYARGVDYSKLSVSGASEVDIDGNGRQGDWTVSGASELDGEEFVMEELIVSASGVSGAKVNVTGTLSAKASGGSNVRYAGRPERISDRSSSVRPL
jgi:hypothetical protein